METDDTRRTAAEMVESARRAKRPRLSKRELARRAGISEGWYRHITTGLRGEPPRAASDETWIDLAEALDIDAHALFAALERPYPDELERRPRAATTAAEAPRRSTVPAVDGGAPLTKISVGDPGGAEEHVYLDLSQYPPEEHDQLVSEATAWLLRRLRERRERDERRGGGEN